MRLNVEKYQSLMKTKGIKDEDVAAKVGLSDKTWADIKNYGYIEQEILERLADLAGTDWEAIARVDPASDHENVIEFIRDSSRATVTFSQPRYVSKMKNIAQKFPEECHIIAENDDGTICASIPTKWVKITTPRQYSEEQKAKLREHAKQMSSKRSPKEGFENE